MRTLTTFDQVLDVFGGPTELGLRIDRSAGCICNWKRKRGRFPSKLYKSMTAELRRRGYTASPKLWGQVELERLRQAA